MLPSPQPQGPRAGPTLWIALALVALAQLRFWPAWSGWHKDDDFRNLRWALAFRDAPWKALTERTAVHGHIRPATLWGHWLGAHLGDGSWWGIHSVHVLLCTGVVLGTFALGAGWWGRKEGTLAALTLLLLPALGELPWWNAWMNSAGEVTFGLFSLAWLHHQLARGRWPWGPLLLCMVAGLFKEPGWVLYPVAALALCLPHLRAKAEPKHWVSALLFPALGLAGLAWTFHWQNLIRGIQGSNFLTALSQLLDPLVFQAPHAGGGLALPVPVLALGLLARLGLRGPALWASSAGVWALAIGMRALALPLGWLLLLGLPLCLAVASWQSWRGARPPVDLLLAVTGIAVMAPFPFPHPVQMLGGLVGLSLAMAAGWLQLERARVPLALMACLAMAGAWLRQEEPVDGEFPSRVSAQAQREVLAGIRLAQSVGATHATVLNAPDDRQVVLALAGLALLQEAPAMNLDGIGIGPGHPSADLLDGLVVPRTNLRHKARPGGEPVLTLSPGSYLLSVSGPAQTRGTWVEVYGDCGSLSLGPGQSPAEEMRHLAVERPCELEIRADTRAPPEVHLSALPPAKISYRSADPSSQAAFFQDPATR